MNAKPNGKRKYLTRYYNTKFRDWNQHKIKVLIATGQLIGKDFDSKLFSTLFLATPIRFNGRVLQYMGCILRPAPGKSKARDYDYVDVNVGVLVSSARARKKVYSKNKER